MADKIARRIEMEDAEYFLALWRHQHADASPPGLGTQSLKEAMLVFFNSCGDGRDADKFLRVFRSGMRTFHDALPDCRDMKPRQRATRARAAGKSLAELWNSLRERCGLDHLPVMSEPSESGASRAHPPSAKPDHSPAVHHTTNVTLPPMEGSELPPEPADNRNWTLRLIADRRGQTSFRDALFKRFGEKCVITGCDLADVLEAAHIKPYAGEPGDQEPDNGLLLRADIHILFDLHLIGVNPDTLAVVWHSRLKDNSHYGPLANRRYTLPTPDRKRPRTDALRTRRQWFREDKGVS